MILGQELRKRRDAVLKSKEYMQLAKKQYLKEGIVDILIARMFLAADAGESSIEEDAYDIINDIYHAVLRLDFRSREKKDLVIGTLRFLEYEFPDVKADWVGQHKIHFTWW